MNALQLLKDHPKAAIVIKQWFLEIMLESLKDESLPEDFKEMVRKEGIDDDRVAGLINASPRALFDVLDSHKVYVQTSVDEAGGFWWNISELKSTTGYEHRKNAEASAIEAAIKLLNDKL